MAEEGEEYITMTQETLGKLITKPKMSEKHLKKPPFRFLHDIVMEVTRATSFSQGLYTTEESDAAQLSDKQAKLDFLNKAINVTAFALGEKIDVSANKIVAGLEPEKTNAFLVKLHAAATTSVGEKSEAAVQRVLNGETAAAPSKEKKKKKEEDAPPPPPPDGGDAAADEEAKKEEERRKRSERKKKEEEKKRRAEEEAAKAAAAEEAPQAPSPPPDDGEEERKKEEAKRKKDDERRRRKEEEKRRQAEEAQAALEEQAAAEAHAAAQAAAEEEQQRAMEAAAYAQQEDMPPPPPPDGGVAAGPEEIAARAEAMLAQRAAENGEDIDTARAGLRPERPRTAGRKPPKVTSKVTTSEQSTAPVNVAAPVIIAEGARDDDDEDMFDSGPQPGAPPPPPPMAEEGGQHGALVSNLLAEKKKEEERERLKREEEETREEFDDGQKGIKMGKLKRKKDQGSNLAEVDTAKLGESIQQLCQAANPLGKSIDLVHADIANMGKELDHWRQEYREASEAYSQQLKMTDELLQPLYVKVAELDDKIAEQKAKIRNSRSRISKNDLKIQNLLESVVLAK